MKKFLVSLLLLAALIAAGVWFKVRPTAGPDPEEAKPAAKVETTPLLEQAIARTLEVFGTVVAAPSGEQAIAAPYDCLVRRILVSAGTPVGAGDVLLEVDPSPDAKLAADSARSLLALATGNLAAVQQRYDLKLATNPELLAARQAAEDARLKADSFAARGLGGDGRILAAHAGVVAKLDLAKGTLVPAGGVLVVLDTEGQLEARLAVEAADVRAVATGQPVTLESSNRSDSEKVAGTVRTIGAALDPVTGAVDVRASLPAGVRLLVGEHLRARIEVQRKDRALVVPRNAVLADGDQQVMFTVVDGKAVRHMVQVGLAAGDRLEVISPDLHAGDLVVTLGNYELEDGRPVQPPDPGGAAKGAEARP